MEKVDFLVIGGGIAGLSFALEVAPLGSVMVLFKRDVNLSATAWAQGGIAAVATADDSAELHKQDTLIAGDGLCNEEIVDLVVKQGPERINFLLKQGVKFDQHLNKEAGHSKRRIHHAGDASGAAIHTALLHTAKSHPNIQFVDYVNAIDLITSKKLKTNDQLTAYGAYILQRNGAVKTISARKIMIATGGAGKVYLYTSNPDIASGDGIAIGYRAGARVANMEFFQFHPTCLFHPTERTFLITEAIRGEGGTLRTINGDRFMPRYHKDAEMAPRDIVARAIDNELKSLGDDFVLLDISHQKESFIIEHFPTIYQKCKSLGIDISKQPIPVVPAAHYCCGGIVTDRFARTDIRNVYAAGECANTGLHGANRLASNSLIEGVVFAHQAAIDAKKTFSETKHISLPEWDSKGAVDSDEQVIITHNWDEIRRSMWNYVGIVRSNKRLMRALERSNLIEREIQDYYWNFTVTNNLIELRNLSLVARLVIQSAIKRKESRGLHYTIDYPEKNGDFMNDTILRREDF